jgi:hypothetical protein
LRNSAIVEVDRQRFRELREPKKFGLFAKNFRVPHEVEVEDVVGFGARRARNGYLKIVT